VLTADHGFMPAPEFSQAQGQPAGRLSASQKLTRVNAELERSFGAPKLAAFISASTAVVLDRKLIAEKGLNFEAVADAVRASLVADPAIAAAYTRRELETGSKAGAPFFDQMRRTWHKDVSGDVQFALKPLWMATSSAGTPRRTARRIPTTRTSHLVYGPRWVKPAASTAASKWPTSRRPWLACCVRAVDQRRTAAACWRPDATQAGQSRGPRPTRRPLGKTSVKFPFGCGLHLHLHAPPADGSAAALASCSTVPGAPS
jgi:hypothetical protein